MIFSKHSHKNKRLIFLFPKYLEGFSRCLREERLGALEALHRPAKLEKFFYLLFIDHYFQREVFLYFFLESTSGFRPQHADYVMTSLLQCQHLMDLLSLFTNEPASMLQFVSNILRSVDTQAFWSTRGLMDFMGTSSNSGSILSRTQSREYDNTGTSFLCSIKFLQKL